MEKAIKFFLVLVGSGLIMISLPNFALAGFGITPPYVKNDHLTRNSVYEQKITLVRGNPDKDLRVQVVVDVPRANDWFSIDKGEEFILPKGKSKFPIFIKVKIPDKAEFGQYKGQITLKTSSLKKPLAGTVGIVLGAQIDVSLKIIDKKIFNFKVLGTRLFDLEEGHKFLWMFIPGKIRFSMTVKNLGNVRAKPTKVHFDIYNSKGDKLLESVNARKIKGTVLPFETKEIIAEIPTELQSGSYNVAFSIYRNEEIIKKGSLHLSILPYKSIDGYKGYGLWEGLSWFNRIILLLIIIFILAIFAGAFFFAKRKIYLNSKKE